MKYNYDRVRKSHIEHGFTEEVIANDISGSVIGLVGPEWKRHIHHYRKMANGRNLIIAERDPVTFEMLSRELKNYRDVTVVKGDIFDILKNHPGVALFDFDACATPDGLEAEGFSRKLQSAFEGRLFRTERFAIILTFSQRNERPGSGDNLIKSVKDIADYYRHSITVKIERSYRQAGMMPMKTILFIIQPITNNPHYMIWKERTKYKTGKRILDKTINNGNKKQQ
jgi:hypothetical protein